MQVSLKRERLEMSPVYATLFEHGQHTLGYIRLVNFGQHAAADMHAAIKRLQVLRCALSCRALLDSFPYNEQEALCLCSTFVALCNSTRDHRWVQN